MLKKLSGFNLGEFFAIKVALELPQKFPQIHPSISRKKLDYHFSGSGHVSSFLQLHFSYLFLQELNQCHRDYQWFDLLRWTQIGRAEFNITEAYGVGIFSSIQSQRN